MKRVIFFVLISVTGLCVASAQITSPPKEALGVHVNFGRGCATCHTPHSGSRSNGIAIGGISTLSDAPLWGPVASTLYVKAIRTGDADYLEVLPDTLATRTPDVDGELRCLTCHDGNYAPRVMMKNQVYENLPVPSENGDSNTIPTSFEKTTPGGATLINHHPSGLNVKIGCGGEKNWDCFESKGVISMKGANSSRFVSNYGFFVKPANYNHNAVVLCTTCHDPHGMNVVAVTNRSISGLPRGNYATMYFLRAPYNRNDTNPGSNQTSQFCCQCHAAMSNEMQGSTAGTVF